MKNPIFLIFLTLAAGGVVLYFILSSAKGMTNFGGTGTTSDMVATPVVESPTIRVSPTLEVQSGSSGFGGLDR